jgi:hypothetical protein
MDENIKHLSLHYLLKLAAWRLFERIRHYEELSFDLILDDVTVEGNRKWEFWEQNYIYPETRKFNQTESFTHSIDEELGATGKAY